MLDTYGTRSLGNELGLLSTYMHQELLPSEEGEVKVPCPFHKDGTESTPSFYYNIYKNVGYCHTCGEGWSLFTLLHKLGAPQHVLDGLPKKSVVHERLEDEPVYGVDAFDPAILKLYAYKPATLIEAGFDAHILRDYDVGFDQYTLQITFPIRDHLGGLVAIMGRSTTGRKPKYLPYGEDILGAGYTYKKKFYLWGAHKLYPLAMSGKLDKIIVTEGFKAALWCIQCGFHAVALMGLHISKYQLNLLETLGAPLVLFPDQDEYGYRAITKLGEYIGSRLPLHIVEYKGDEPDAVAREDVPKVIESAIPHAGWLLKRRNLR